MNSENNQPQPSLTDGHRVGLREVQPLQPTLTATAGPTTQPHSSLLMGLLKRVLSTDDKISTALTRSGTTELARLEKQREVQIMAVGMGLTNITASSLPEIMRTGEQISLLRKADEPTLLKALIVLIGITNDALNVPRMNATQMLDAARHIAKTYWFLKPEEIAYAFDQGRSGRYGPAYNRLDLEGLTKWLHAYDTTERLLLCEQARQQETEQLGEDNRLSVETVRESYKRFAEGEPLVQQKLDKERPEQEQRDRTAKGRYQMYRQQYFADRPAVPNQTEPTTNENPSDHS